MQAILVRQVVLQPGLQPIEAIRLADGNKGASVRSMCALLDLSRQGQVRRIQRTPELAPALTQVTLATPAGPRLFDILIAYAIPAWLLGISTNRLPTHKQALVLVMKEGIIDAIERAFSDQETQPSSLITAEPGLDAWQQAQEGLAAIASGVGQLQTALSAMEHSQIVLLARMAALERPVHTSDKAGLPPERIAHMYILARAVRAKTGAPIAETLTNLARQFRVSDASDIPAVAWRDVLAWFEGLLGT